jgi:zona occludens toxin
MIVLTTGTPGSGKTLFAVHTIVEREKSNAKHLKLNPHIFNRNFEKIENNCDKQIFINVSDFDGDQKVYEDMRNALAEYDQTNITVSTLFDSFQSFSGFSLEQRYEAYFYDTVIYNLILNLINNQLDLKLEHILDVRQQYADINGLKVDHVLKTPDDWRTTPDGSIVYYDEAQQHERYRSGTQSNKDEIVQKLQVHRHTGHDIWFITQSPRFLNAFVLDLVGEHYHLHRPYGAKLASVYYWRSCRKQPQSTASRELAENEFLFKYPKSLFNHYKSATSHSVKFKIPKKFFIISVVAICLGIFVWNMIFSDKTQKFINPESVKEEPNQEKNQQGDKQETASIAPDQLDQECRKGINVEKPECVQWFDSKSKQNNSESNIQRVSYNPDTPFDQQEIQDSIQYDVTAMPVFSGCTKFNGKYYAYTQQGTKLNVSSEDCRKLIENGDRPFNYFAKQQQQQQFNSAQIQQNNQIVPVQGAI